MSVDVARHVVLTIDDDLIVRKSIRHFLEDFGYQIIEADKGMQGLHLFEQEKPDLVLVDLRMPEVDGLDVLKAITERSPDTPTIVISGAGVIGDVVEALRLGAWDYLNKPIEDMTVLLHSVQKVLERADFIKQNRAYQEHLEREVSKRTGQLRKANQELKESVLKYQLLAENLKDVVIALSPQGVITYCSPASQELSGYSPDELEGQYFTEYIIEESAIKRTLELFQKNAQSSEAGAIEPIEFCMHHKDGSAVPVEITSKLVIKNEQVISIQCVVRDISERRLAEKELRWKSEALEQSIDGIAIADQDGKLMFVNTAWALMHGYSKEELKEKNIAFFHTEEQYILDLEPFYQKVAEAGGNKGDVGHVKKNGVTFPTRMSATLIKSDDGEPIGVVAIARDITEEIKLESQLRQAQRVESIGRLAGGVAHDFNNLLSPILGYTELLLNEFLPDDPRYEDLMEILNASNRAKVLIRQLLAFSRKQVLAMRTIQLSQVVSGFVGILRSTIRENIEIITDLSISSGVIKADVSQLEQIIMNLAVNAQDAMVKGGKLVIETQTVLLDESWASTQPVGKSGLYSMLEVRDTGNGIDNHTIKNIFEPFFTTKEKGKGTGLGLSTVQGIVEQHGGSIWVSSEPGKGTTFKIYFPCVGEAEEVVIPSVERRAPVEGSGTVLVVEDDEAVRNVVCSILDKHGYNVINAKNALDCRSLVDDKKGSVDLLLADIVMPKINGKELYQQLRSSWPDLKVLYMSGYTNDVIAHEGILNEGVDLIQKPISVQTLTAKVREVLER